MVPPDPTHTCRTHITYTQHATCDTELVHKSIGWFFKEIIGEDLRSNPQEYLRFDFSIFRKTWGTKAEPEAQITLRVV